MSRLSSVNFFVSRTLPFLWALPGAVLALASRDLKRRVEELEPLVQKQAVAANEEVNADARARTLAAALARKEGIIRELRDRLDAAQASLAAGNATAEAGGEELEMARRTSARLRMDLAKREALLRSALADLEKVSDFAQC